MIYRSKIVRRETFSVVPRLFGEDDTRPQPRFLRIAALHFDEITIRKRSFFDYQFIFIATTMW